VIKVARVAKTGTSRFPARAAMTGGLLWALFGIFEMLAPLGEAKVYVESLGYELVTRPLVFQLYHLPGAVALSLLALALVGVTAGLGLAYPGRRGLAYLVVGLALASLAGTVILLAPMAILGLSLGRLLLGAATLLAGLQAYRSSIGRGFGIALLLLGLLGVSLLALQPLTWALMWFPPVLSAAIMVAFGLGWLLVGVYLKGKRDTGASVLSHGH
jgi:hypothetical protein